MNFKIYSILIISCFLLYILVLSFGSHTGFALSIIHGKYFPYLSDKPLTEDGFYMLTVSRQISEGNGFSYNNDIKTTGVHPLATLIYALLFKIVCLFRGDKFFFLRMIILYAAVMLVLFGIVLYLISLKLMPDANRAQLLMISFLTSVLNFKLLIEFANGLETGIYLLLLSVCVLYSIIYLNGSQTNLKSLLLGLLFGLTMLGRSDFLVIALLFLGLLLITKSIRIKNFLIIIIVMFLVYSPWLYYIYSVTGNILTSSAEQTTSFSGLLFYPNKFINFFYSLFLYLVPFVYTGSKVFLAVILCAVSLAVVFFLSRKVGFRLKNLKNVNVMIMWLIAISVLLIIYFMFSDADYFFIRYFTILSVIILPLYNCFFTYLLSGLKNKMTYIVLFAIPLVFFIQAYFYFHSGKAVNHLGLRPGFINKNFDSAAVIGLWQSGVTGFFCPKVYNLDGKLDYNCLQYSEHGELVKYVDSIGINVLIEWNRTINTLGKNYIKNKWELYSKDIGDKQTACYIRKGYEDNVLLLKK
jgi:hypothetical protein